MQCAPNSQARLRLHCSKWGVVAHLKEAQKARSNARTLLDNLKGKWFTKEDTEKMESRGSAKIQLPSKDLVRQIFTQSNVGQAAESFSNLEQLKMRKFMCNMLLAQVVYHVTETAKELWKRHTGKALDEVAALFNVSVPECKEVLQQEIDANIAPEDTKLLKNVAELLDEDAFVSMLVGVTLLSIAPTVHAAILPTIEVRVAKQDQPATQLSSYKDLVESIARCKSEGTGQARSILQEWHNQVLAAQAPPLVNGEQGPSHRYDARPVTRNGPRDRYEPLR